MASLREKPPKAIAGIEIAEVRDYLKDEITFKDGHKEKIVGLPASNVLKFVLADGSTYAVRPSGTEPKVKFYVETKGDKKEGLKEKAARMNEDFRAQAKID
jgi:phosphoglucomutase